MQKCQKVECFNFRKKADPFLFLKPYCALKLGQWRQCPIMCQIYRDIYLDLAPKFQKTFWILNTFRRIQP